MRRRILRRSLQRDLTAEQRDAYLARGRTCCTFVMLLLLVAARLPPEPELLLHGTVGVAEEHRVLAGFVAVLLNIQARSDLRQALRLSESGQKR